MEKNRRIKILKIFRDDRADAEYFGLCEVQVFSRPQCGRYVPPYILFRTHCKSSLQARASGVQQRRVGWGHRNLLVSPGNFSTPSPHFHIFPCQTFHHMLPLAKPSSILVRRVSHWAVGLEYGTALSRAGGEPYPDAKVLIYSSLFSCLLTAFQKRLAEHISIVNWRSTFFWI